MAGFDIIEYMSSLTGYSFEKPVLERIARERNVFDKDFGELSQRDKDLIRADMLFVIYTTPTQTGSVTKQHGPWSQSVGSSTITDKKNIYAIMMGLYNKWGDDMAEVVTGINSGIQWLD